MSQADSSILILLSHQPKIKHTSNGEQLSQFLELCSITASASSSSSAWHTNKTSSDAQERFTSVDSLLRDYVTAFSSTDNVVGLLPRALVDAILVMSLGIAKQKFLRSCDAQVKPDAESQLATLFWGHDQFISLPVSFSNSCGIRTSALDYVLWYGNTAELETNLIVLRVDETVDSVVNEQYYAALAAISMIHHNRTKRLIIKDTYGLVSDGLTWTFLHVNKEHEHSFLTLNWLEGEARAIVCLIGKIMDSAVRVKMKCEETQLSSLEWPKMATMWDPPQHKHSEEMDSTCFAHLKAGLKDLLYRATHGECVDHWLEELFKSACEQSDKETSGHGRERFESVAVKDIDPNKVMGMFRLRRESRPTNHWRLEPWEVRNVSSHLVTMLEQIRLVYGHAGHNEAVIRLMIDAIFLDVLASIKVELYEGEVKDKGNGPSTESSLSRKSLHMALETNVSYILPPDPRRGKCRGKTDTRAHGLYLVLRKPQRRRDKPISRAGQA